MTRLIDADALVEELKLSSNMHAENSREFSLLHRDIVIVNEQPTVDAVPVEWIKRWSKEPMTEKDMKLAEQCEWNILEWLIADWQRGKKNE